MSKTTAPGESVRHHDVGFHAGELAVQRRAGTREEAERLSPMLDPAELRGGIVAFLADRTFAVITARDADGRLWSSPLTGPAGFLEAVTPTTLVDPRPPPGRRPAARAARRAAGRARGRRVRDATPRPGQRHPHDGRRRRSRDRRRAGLRELSAVHPPARPRPGRPRPARRGRRAAGRGPLPGRHRADRRARTRSSSAPRTRNAARTPRTGAARRGSSGSTAAGSGGRITRATTSSTPSATSPSIPRRPCSSSTSTPGARSSCPVPPRSTGTPRAGRATTGRPAGEPSSPCSGWWRAACSHRGRSRTTPTRAIPPSPTD